MVPPWLAWYAHSIGARVHAPVALTANAAGQVYSGIARKPCRPVLPFRLAARERFSAGVGAWLHQPQALYSRGPAYSFRQSHYRYLVVGRRARYKDPAMSCASQFLNLQEQVGADLLGRPESRWLGRPLQAGWPRGPSHTAMAPDVRSVGSKRRCHITGTAGSFELNAILAHLSRKRNMGAS